MRVRRFGRSRSSEWLLCRAATTPAHVRSNGFSGTRLAQGQHSGREILVEGDPRLFNQYELIVVDPAKHPNINPATGAQFADWIISEEGQALIAAFRIGD